MNLSEVLNIRSTLIGLCLTGSCILSAPLWAQDPICKEGDVACERAYTLEQLKKHEALAASGDLKAKFELAMGYLELSEEDGGNRARGKQLLHEAADSGYLQAQFELAQALMFGRVMAADYTAAEHYYKLAADNGNTRAQLLLVEEFSGNRRLRKDIALARHYYTQAQAHDSKGQAAATLGAVLFAEGGNELRNEAIVLLETAARNGQGKAAYTLYQESRQNRYQTQDVAIILPLLREAANKKHISAMIDLGAAYLDGTAIQRDEDQGRALLEEASKAGSADAAMILFNYYFISLEREMVLPESQRRQTDRTLQTWLEDGIYFYALAAVNGDSTIRAQFIEDVSEKTALEGQYEFRPKMSNISGAEAGDRITDNGIWSAAMARYAIKVRGDAVSSPWLSDWYYSAEEHLKEQPGISRLIDKRVSELSEHWRAAQEKAPQYQQ